MTPVAILLGIALASGVLLLVDGLRPGSTALGVRYRPRGIEARRMTVAAITGFLALIITRWPAAAAAAGTMAWFGPQLLGGKAARDAAMARTEAIATWTEMLRDTIQAAHGIEAAIAATADVAPAPIRSEIRSLAGRIEHQTLTSALAEFAGDLAHPIADLVVAALDAAASHSTRDLADLLGTLAAAARDEASMHLSIEAARARVRTAVRVIAAVTVATASALILLNPSYVEVYGSTAGQGVLLFIFACWGGALWWLAQMSRFRSPERFLRSPEERGRPR